MSMMYDFDKTLCTKNMQEYSFIPKVNMKPDDFWSESKKLAQKQKMDDILAYMYLMLGKAKIAKKSVRCRDFKKLGKDLEFFPGVENWFARVNQLGVDLDVKIEHLEISSVRWRCVTA
jgi:hypothetical protein